MLSSLSVNVDPAGRLRNGCSWRYLRIPPLHLQFHRPLSHSRRPVSNAAPGLGPGFKHPTQASAYAPFTPSDSEQRLPPSYYRGCWHEVSRGFLCRYIHPPPKTELYSLPTVVYTPKCFIPHMALLRQTFVHCARFPTAASRRSLGRFSVPMCPYTLSGRIPIVALVGRYPANKLMGRELVQRR